MKSLSCVRLLATPWTAAYQAPLSMGFSRQEYWSGVPLPSPSLSIGFSKQEYWSELPFPFPGHLPDPGIARESLAAPALQADSLPLNHQGSPLALSISQFGPTAFQVSRISCGWQLPLWIVQQRLSSLDQVDQQRASH